MELKRSRLSALDRQGTNSYFCVCERGEVLGVGGGGEGALPMFVGCFGVLCHLRHV